MSVLASTASAQGYEQTAVEARAQDVAIIAATNGWSLSGTGQFVDEQPIFADLVEEVKDAYPLSYSSAVYAASPGEAAHLYFKGSIPAGVLDFIAASGLSVTPHGNTGKNYQDWRSQFLAIETWLEGQGQPSWALSFDSVGSIELVIGNGDPLPTLPPSLSSDVVVTGVADIGLTETGAVRGGSNVYDSSGVRNCTSSWNVEDQSTGEKGLVTADHCVGVSEVEDKNGVLQSTTWKDGHHGKHGDFEWLSSTGGEVAKFWADSGVSRKVCGVKSTFFRNNTTCVYGRTTNVRKCDAVYRTSVSFSNGLKNMVLTDNKVVDYGDSGGGWSELNTAHGVTNGFVTFNGGVRSTYSKAKRIDNALDVDILINPSCN